MSGLSPYVNAPTVLLAVLRAQQAHDAVGSAKANRVAISEHGAEMLEREPMWAKLFGSAHPDPLFGMKVEVDIDLAEDECRVWYQTEDRKVRSGRERMAV